MIVLKGMASAGRSNLMSVKLNAKYFVGIDLGTTHTAVAYLDKNATKGSDQENAATLFEIEQLVGPGKVAKRPLLPSFRYHPAAGEIADSDRLLPWSNRSDAFLANELNGVVVGEWARLLGSKSQGRLVSSAKSWLSHHKVDRNANILPWGSDDDIEKVSPVFASASYLHHIVQAWNREFPCAPLAEQEVVITIPASFDEGARGLTVQAAKLAGLHSVLLLEEPQAVCYDWYKRHQQTAIEQLKNIPLLMVCDVGGGTTDLSLISAAVRNDRGTDKLELNRIGVGDHLMLGGDNIDLALAHVAEQQLSSGDPERNKKKLSSAALAQLIQQTRIAKETLLADNAPESATITLLGSGSRLIGGAKHCQLTREQVRAVALDGFFPQVELSERPQQRRSALLEFGLPYVADAAVPKHLAEFIGNHQGAIATALKSSGDSATVPAAVLFNGGVFNSPPLKQRLLDQFNHWRGDTVQELENLEPNLAVAFGAVAYAGARRGQGVKIGGGSARSFFLKIDSVDATATAQGICLLPKGTEEECDITLAQHRFALTLGQPVSFSLCANSQDRSYSVGDKVDLEGEHFIDLPPLVTALKSSSDSTQQVQVNLVARLTEVGTLQIDCAAVDSLQRWSLEFSIRGAPAQQLASTAVSLPKKFSEALALIDSAFTAKQKQGDGKTKDKAIKSLRPQLEKMLGDRGAWSAHVLRPICDQLLASMTRRRRSEAHEQNWLRLAGFSVRPGFGDALDNWRIEQLWPLYREGLQYSKSTQAWGDWWTFWRRVSGGLSSEQQQVIYADIAPYLDIDNIKKRQVVADAQKKSYEDMVLLAASLENISEDDKIDLANWLLERSLTDKKCNNPAHWWAVGRVCSRSPFYGSDHNVLDAEDVSGLLEHLLGLDWKTEKHIAFAAVMMSRKCGDRSRDIDDDLRAKVIEKLRSIKAPDSWIEMVAEVKQLDEAESKKIYGDGLPAGLKLLG